MELRESAERADLQNRRLREDALPSGVDVFVVAANALILSGRFLCVRVRHIAVGGSGERGEAERILRIARLAVEAQESSERVSVIVKIVRIHRIEESIRFRPVHRSEVAECL